MSKSILVFDSHPVQYRVPIWKAVEQFDNIELHVVYASDCSVKGHDDIGFGKVIVWDEPLLDGYNNTILNCVKGIALSGWSSLTGMGVGHTLDIIKPKYVLLTGLNYRYDFVALLHSKKRNIPVFLRWETQDQAFSRSKIKISIRFIYYFFVYKLIDKFLFIGKLNKEHYLRHGVLLSKLFPAHYATTDRFINLDSEIKNRLRFECRSYSNINESKFVIGFSGKLIQKKNPEILYEILEYLQEKLLKNTCIYFLGSGELEGKLKQRAKAVESKFGVKTIFTGFVNQTEMPSHYLAMDILILPSRKMGETWGLVCNEAMQAGCGVIVSNNVGCHADFAKWERFRVFQDGDVKELARRVEDLFAYQRDFDWAKELLNDYSIDATAKSIIKLI